MNDRRIVSLTVCVTLCVAAVAALLLLGGAPVRAQGVTRYVATPGFNTGDCTNPSMPCGRVQYAVDQAASDDIIKVAGGVYTGVQGRPVPPWYGSGHHGIITQVVYISKTITIRGGYAVPGFPDPPDPVANPTTLDAQGQGRVFTIVADPSAGSGQAITPTIEGLRLTGGNAAGLGGGDWGGDAGGGLYIVASEVTLRNSQVLGNTASEGGGLFVAGSDATLSGNTLSGNASTSYGGGGLYLVGSDVTLNGNTISNNTAGASGGGVELNRSDATLNNNTICGNTSWASGGGLRLWDSNVTLTNNIVADNQADSSGSGLIISSSSVRLLHTSIARNGGGDGSGVHVANSTLALTNTILVSHTLGITVAAGSTATLESTLWYGNGADWGGGGTINHANDHTGHPAFLDPDGRDYHLGPGSAALDQGVDAGVMRDLDNEPRLGVPDLGADEYWPPGALKHIYLPLVIRSGP